MQPHTPHPAHLVSIKWIAALRIMLGLVILTTWGANLYEGYYTPDGLALFFAENFPQSENPLTWYAAFIDNVILPARYVFAPFQLVGEFLLGFFLLIGLFTPWTSLATIFFIANTFLATFGHDWPWSYGMMFGILIVVIFTRAGRAWGLDARLAARRPQPPLPWLY